MSPTPPRDTASGRAYNDLKNLAKRHGRDPSEYFTLFALEGFLTRLALSSHADQLVLKGGVLMAAFSARRPTRDIDLAASGFPNNTAEAKQRVRLIAALNAPDGLDFDLESIRAEPIRDQSDYQGVRVHLSANLATAKIPFHVDINFGDPVWPPPTPTKLPLLLGGEIVVLGYPIPMTLAEKTVTAIERGEANTRWRDFVDIASIAATTSIDADNLRQSITTVANRRGVEIKPLAATLSGMAQVAQPKWTAWRRKQRLENSTPRSFQELIDACYLLIDPVLEDRARGRTWDPGRRTWA